ncbi:hypothetical protein [Nocardioides albus]|uniref:Uncharacterized protein n=1 Tax=Nocardioides albus TaxID=1841 RepID=A0A7W5A1X4_9ACTN|nr:hypothetical protein [Nocardioides albus]MBB3087839.1 hypothetical protein [Nocardioides albus]
MAATNPPGAPARSTAGFGGSTADQVLTIVLIVLGLGGCAVASFIGAFSIMASDGCFETCNYTLMNIGVAIMVFTPWVCWLAFGIWGIVRLARRKLAVLVVAAGGVLAIALYILGVFLLTVTIG